MRIVLDTNVGGVFNVTRAVVPHMIARRAGKIVNVSSVAGEKGGRGQTNYAASKGAINALTRALAVELAPRRITVNCVAPGRHRDRDVAGDPRARRRRGEVAHPAAAVRPAAGRRARGVVPRVAATPTTSPARCCTSTAASRWSDKDGRERNHQAKRSPRSTRRSPRSSPTRSAVDAGEVKLDVPLIEGLDAESIDFLDLVFRLERAFGVKIPRGKIVEDARGDLPEAEFEQKGLVTDVGSEAAPGVPERGPGRPLPVAAEECRHSAPLHAGNVLQGGRARAARRAVARLTGGARCWMAERFSAFSFVDRITTLEPGRRAVGRYAIPVHLPRFPIVSRRGSDRPARRLGRDVPSRFSPSPGCRARRRDAVLRQRDAGTGPRPRSGARGLRRRRGRLRRLGPRRRRPGARAPALRRADAADGGVRRAGSGARRFRGALRSGRAGRAPPGAAPA